MDEKISEFWQNWIDSPPDKQLKQIEEMLDQTFFEIQNLPADNKRKTFAQIMKNYFVDLYETIRESEKNGKKIPKRKRKTAT